MTLRLDQACNHQKLVVSSLIKTIYIYFRQENHKNNETYDLYIPQELERQSVQVFFFFQNQSSRGVLWKRFLQKFVIFTGKHLCWSLFLIKLQAFTNPSTSLKRDSEHLFWRISTNGHFPANIYFFKVSNRNTKKRCGKKVLSNNKNTRTTSLTSFWYFYC